MPNSPEPLWRTERYTDDSDTKSIRADIDWVNGDEKPTEHYMEDHQPSRLRRPIDLVRNPRRTNSDYGQLYSSESDEVSSSADSPTWKQVLTARKVRRSTLLFLLLLILLWGNWEWWLRPLWDEHVSLRRALDERMRTGQGWFGTNMRPVFTDMIQLKTLDASLIPQGGKTGKRNRLIFVGDVHGCKKELVSLLSKVSYNSKTDHLILTGDLISKGPHSPAVVDLALSLNASCVRGNHEDRVLLAHHDMHKLHLSSPGPREDMKLSGAQDTLEEERFSHRDYTDRQLAKSLSQRQIDYLAACPVILRVGEIRGMGEVSVVHAGLIPGVDLKNQDPLAAMTMRTVDLHTHVPSSIADGVPWSKLWNKYQSFLPRHLRSTVIYGHDSRRGLSLSKYSKGIDTGCVRGGRLTALVMEYGGKWRNAKMRTVSVKCKDNRATSMGAGQ